MKTTPQAHQLICVSGLILACLFTFQSLFAAEGPLEGSSRRPCTGQVTLYLDDKPLWHRDSGKMNEMKEAVMIPGSKMKSMKGILLATLIESEPNIRAIEVSNCKGKLRRFEGEKLQAKKDTLYLVITHYRGLKLYNTHGEKGRGSRLKNIDQVRLITRPE